jgi:hypothetical protein
MTIRTTKISPWGDPPWEVPYHNNRHADAPSPPPSGGSAAGQEAPIHLSAHVPDGDEHKHPLESWYTGHVRRTT